MNTALPVVRACDLEILTEQERWLIRAIWGAGCVGMIGGAPKSWKTWFGLELVFSVVTGLPFLGKFVVEKPGRALIYLAEDSRPQVRSRLECLCASRKVDIRKLDLFIITSPVLRLDLPDQQEKLRDTVMQIQPKVVLLDPLVRLHRLDENNATEMAGLLGYLRGLQRELDVAIVLVHHVSKRARPQPGQALRGSSDLHAWTDSAAYLTWRNNQLHLILEHRAAQALPPMVLDLVAGPDGDSVHLELRGEVSPSDPQQKPTMAGQVLKVLRTAAKPMKRTEIREVLKVNNEKLGATLLVLQKQGRIRRNPQGWELTARIPAACGPKEQQQLPFA